MTLWTVALSGVLSLGVNVGAVAQAAPAGPQTNKQTQAPQGTAQQGAPQQLTTDERIARLTQILNLTPAQQQQMRPILEQAQAKMQALAADNATPIADRQAQAQALRASVRSQMDAVLTPEQKQRIVAMSQHGPGGPGSSPAPQSRPQTPPQK
jgi:Spy/CpxP family protein refolding chaperone